MGKPLWHPPFEVPKIGARGFGEVTIAYMFEAHTKLERATLNHRDLKTFEQDALAIQMDCWCYYRELINAEVPE